MRVERIYQLPELDHLLEESQQQQFRFVARLIDEFQDGKNRFDQPGEALFAVMDGSTCSGIGGVTRDPNGVPDIGRVRRVYLSQRYRGLGVGRRLMMQIEHWGRDHFQALQLFTDSERAAGFYEALGYRRVKLEGVSHMKRFD